MAFIWGQLDWNLLGTHQRVNRLCDQRLDSSNNRLILSHQGHCGCSKYAVIVFMILGQLCGLSV